MLHLIFPSDPGRQDVLNGQYCDVCGEVLALLRTETILVQEGRIRVGGTRFPKNLNFFFKIEQLTRWIYAFWPPLGFFSNSLFYMYIGALSPNMQPFFAPDAPIKSYGVLKFRS